MLDLARILRAVTAVTARHPEAVTPEPALLLAVTAVTAVTAENSEVAAPGSNDTGPDSGGLSRVSSSECNCRNCRNPSNGAPCAVTAGQPATVTAVTGTAAKHYGTGRESFGRLLPEPQPLATCAECEHFARNPMNPSAGVGRCRLGSPDGPGNLPHYPDALRLCRAFRVDFELS